MGLTIRTKRNLPIGVDLGSSSLKMAQLSVDGQGVELLSAASAEVPFECRGDVARRLEFQTESCRSLLRSADFRGRNAILGLPAAAVLIQPVKIPAGQGVDAGQVVRESLQGRLPCPVADAVIRHFVPGGRRQVVGTEQAIAVAVPRDELGAYMSVAERAGLRLVGVNVEPCAVAECFVRLFRRAGDESQVTLLLDIGWSSTQVVLTRGHNLVFARNLAFGGQSLVEEMTAALSVGPELAHEVRCKMLEGAGDPAAEEDLFRLLERRVAEVAEEITQCLRYYESSFPAGTVDRVLFLGGQAHEKRLCQSIAKRLNLPAQVGDAMVGIKCAGRPGRSAGLEAPQPHPSWAVAIGLSLGATIAA